MLTKTEAIVLHALKYGEQRVIVDMFTRQAGRQAFIVTLPRSARSRMKKQYLQPLTLLRIEADVRPRQQLQRLADTALLTPLPRLLSDPKKLSLGLFVSEFLYHALRDEQQNEPLFDYVRSSVEWLDSAAEGYANFHLVFLMRLSRFLGFWPNLETQGDYFDLRGATFTPLPPAHRDFLMPREAARIATLMRMDYPTMRLFRLTRAERSRVLELLLLYYRLHLPAFPELRSVGVLHDVFQG